MTDLSHTRTHNDRPWWRLRLLPLLVATLLLPLSACHISYKLNGAALDYSVYKTIHIGQFPIRTPMVYAPLQPMFENGLSDYIARNTRLQTTDGPADLGIEGEFTGYTITGQAVGADALSTQSRLTITVRVRYTNNKDESKSVDQSFSAYRDFDASQDLSSVEDQLCQEITDELYDLIFNSTLGDW
ncbi:MAG: LPS assembly lipoprotein LptE [Candidatus Amulumruptor caecigallinarius]|nr:LPS assembly lipoprotein LptE [Candidatus Amulumruptor caecigallinarius]MCM1396928.1 LPS assembly lipoprotein LptE [Candidatus Amulumruptor caecigallinarius]MCM1454128.1 LPS assembly lipoprotein LptE [bacterium]